MRKVLLFISVVLSLSACSEHADIDVVDVSKVEEVSPSAFAISPEEALENLENFMNEDGHFTRSSKDVLVESLIPIKMNEHLTRGVQDDLDCDNLLYVANFKNEEGYAFLAADKRISEKVISVVEKGSLDKNTISQALDLMTTDGKVFDGFPKSGPGFFTTPETGDEVFINPNTASLYDSSKSDYLIGNLDEEEFLVEDNTNLISSTKRTKSLSSPKLVTSTLCTLYALDEIRRNHDRIESLCSAPRHEEGRGGGGGNDPSFRSYQTAWKNVKVTNNLLVNFRDWHQDSPFNDFFPTRRMLYLVGHSKKCPAGCFPLSIAKVLTYFEQPRIMVCDGIIINWKELKNSYETAWGRPSAAALLNAIAMGCDSWYFYKATFTFPKNATDFMRRVGLSNAHSRNYSFSKVTEMIDKGCPLLIYAIPSKINIFGSHCWNIDGYKIKERQTIYEEYKNWKWEKVKTTNERLEMVHCDFGWRGWCNGYYVSGVFKLNDHRIEHDGSAFSKKTNFNGLLSVITYDKP